MINILCYGDSNTYGANPVNGGRHGFHTRWTRVISDTLGNDYYVIEEGLSGRTTVHDDPKEPGRNGLAYLRPCFYTHQPLDIVVIMLGTNDLKSVFHVSAKQIAHDAGKLIELIQKECACNDMVLPKFLLVSPIHVGENLMDTNYAEMFGGASISKSHALAAELKSVAEHYECAFLDAANHARPSLEDAIHMTAENQISLGKAIAEKLKEMSAEKYEGKS